MKPLWCAVGGKWVKEQKQAARFASNMDVIAYCVALSLSGRIVGFDAFGQQLYQLEIDDIVKLLAAKNGSSRVTAPSSTR